MPDHEHIYHGGRTKKHVKNLIDNGWTDAFTSKSFEIKKYFSIIKKQIMDIEKQKGIATLLLHPSCMKVCDDFRQFEKLCQWINNNNIKTIWCKDLILSNRKNNFE